MMWIAKPVIAVVTSAILVTGCTTVPKDAGFPDVQAAVTERTGQRAQWDRLSADDRSAEVALRKLLSEPLTADAVVQVVLLNNRSLQATYEDLGVAQAEVVQAGLLRNPIFDAELKFAEGGHGTVFEFAVVQDFLDVFYIPLRKGIAENAFEAAKLRVTGSVIDLAGQARAAFYDYEAAEQTLELRQTVVTATEASYDLARRLHAAGNIAAIDLAQERALYEQSKLDLAEAEAAALDGRERLNVLMGLWGRDIEWTAIKRLSDPAPDDADGDLEKRAVERSIDLAIVRNEIQSRARTLGIRRTLGLIPEAEAGVAAEREAEGEWSVGPAFSMPIPLFDQGQAATATARSELERARQQYVATAVEVRSAARAVRNRLNAARARAEYHRQVMLPLRREITERTQLQYNAMQIGAFQLLQAKRDEVEAGVAYIEALRSYWIARTQLQQLISGRLTDLGQTASTTSGMSNATGGGRDSGGH